MAVDSTSPRSGSVKANWSPWSDRANLAGVLGANKGSRGIPAEQLSAGPQGWALKRAPGRQLAQGWQSP